MKWGNTKYSRPSHIRTHWDWRVFGYAKCSDMQNNEYNYNNHECWQRCLELHLDPHSHPVVQGRSSSVGWEELLASSHWRRVCLVVEADPCLNKAEEWTRVHIREACLLFASAIKKSSLYLRQKEKAHAHQITLLSLAP